MLGLPGAEEVRPAQDSSPGSGSVPSGAYQSAPSQPLTSLKQARCATSRWWTGDTFAPRAVRMARPG